MTTNCLVYWNFWRWVVQGLEKERHNPSRTYTPLSFWTAVLIVWASRPLPHCHMCYTSHVYTVLPKCPKFQWIKTTKVYVLFTLCCPQVFTPGYKFEEQPQSGTCYPHDRSRIVKRSLQLTGDGASATFHGPEHPGWHPSIQVVNTLFSRGVARQPEGVAFPLTGRQRAGCCSKIHRTF